MAPRRPADYCAACAAPLALAPLAPQGWTTRCERRGGGADGCCDGIALGALAPRGRRSGAEGATLPPRRPGHSARAPDGWGVRRPRTGRRTELAVTTSDASYEAKKLKPVFPVF